MSFFQDAISIFKKTDLTFVERRKELENVYTFVFEKEKDMTWKAGQHGLFTIIQKKIKDNTRPFTVASAPIENVVKLTTQITKSPSDFKKNIVGIKKRYEN
mgnify:CR=1 FL=1